MKNSTNSKVAPYILAGAVALGGVEASEAIAQPNPYDVFSQAERNYTTYESHGSGDVNNDGKVSLADYDAM